METFTRSGALSISTVPRAATALIVVFGPRGPRRAYIDYIRLNPNPYACYRWAGFDVNPASADAPLRVDPASPECFGGMPLTNILTLQSVMIGSAIQRALSFPLPLGAKYRIPTGVDAMQSVQIFACGRSKFFHEVVFNFF